MTNLKLTGLYTLRPEEMLQHAIALSLEVACGIVAMRRGAQALRAIARDEALSARAAQLILNHMLRGMVASTEPTRADFERLVREVGDLANES